MHVIDLRAASVRIEVTRQLLDAMPMGPVPDPDWRYTDQQGHEHYYTKDEYYPTLLHIADAWEQGEEGDPFVTASHFECAQCGERIVPGTTYITHQEFVPGVKEWKAAASMLPGTVTAMTDIFKACDTQEICHFLFPFGEGDGRVEEVFSASGGPIDLAIRGVGALVQTKP